MGALPHQILQMRMEQQLILLVLAPRPAKPEVIPTPLPPHLKLQESLISCKKHSHLLIKRPYPCINKVK